MSISLDVRGYSSTDNALFQKHLKVVKFCIENGVSFPKETSQFFKGKCGGDDLEDIQSKYILEYIEKGIEIPLQLHSDGHGGRITVKVSEIPEGVDKIIFTLS